MSTLKLPPKGMTREDLIAAMREAARGDADWRNSKTWSMVFYAGDDVIDILKEAYYMFFSENGLNPMAFPSLKKFENEVVAMTAEMLGGRPEAVGCMTSGGTESILMAVKSARDLARAKKPHIKRPEMVLPMSAHPAFEKAAHYLDVEPVHIPLTNDLRADVKAAREAVTENTVLMIGSAPSYPYGTIDPIRELAAIALENKICFHVDACIGGFQLPFLKKMGRPIPDFDFRAPGVTSISADIHKYGYGPKGASVILYRDENIRKHQFFVYADWPGGIYASPSMAGTRPGGAIAAAWAVMNYLGEEGYLRLADVKMKTTKKLMDGINAIPGLKILGKPDMSVFAFDSEKVNVYSLGEAMSARGWYLNHLQMPPALHMMVTPMHSRIVEPFLLDLATSAKELESKGEAAPEGMAAMYGMLGAIPDRKAAREMVTAFIGDLFKYK